MGKFGAALAGIEPALATAATSQESNLPYTSGRTLCHPVVANMPGLAMPAHSGRMGAGLRSCPARWMPVYPPKWSTKVVLCDPSSFARCDATVLAYEKMGRFTACPGGKPYRLTPVGSGEIETPPPIIQLTTRITRMPVAHCFSWDLTSSPRLKPGDS